MNGWLVVTVIWNCNIYPKSKEVVHTLNRKKEKLDMSRIKICNIVGNLIVFKIKTTMIMFPLADAACYPNCLTLRPKLIFL